MGFWGWFIIAGIFGVIFLRQRLTAAYNNSTDKGLTGLNAVCGLLFFGYCMVKLTLYFIQLDQPDVAAPFLLDGAGAALAWLLILGLAQSAKRNTERAHSLQVERLRSSNSATRRQVRQSIAKAQEPGSGQFFGETSEVPPHRLPPLKQPAASAPDDSGAAPVDLGKLLFGEKWQQLLRTSSSAPPAETAGPATAEQRDVLVRLLAEQQRAKAEAELAEDEAKLIYAMDDREEIDAPLSPAAVAEFEQAAPAAVHFPVTAPAPAAAPVVASMPAESVAQTPPQQDSWLSSRKASPVAPASAAPRPAGPVSLGLASGPRPSGPVQLGTGRSLHRPGPVSLGGQPAVLGATEPPQRPKFGYQPLLVSSRLNADSTASPAAPPPPAPPKPPVAPRPPAPPARKPAH